MDSDDEIEGSEVEEMESSDDEALTEEEVDRLRTLLPAAFNRVKAFANRALSRLAELQALNQQRILAEPYIAEDNRTYKTEMAAFAALSGEIIMFTSPTSQLEDHLLEHYRLLKASQWCTDILASEDPDFEQVTESAEIQMLYRELYDAGNTLEVLFGCDDMEWCEDLSEKRIEDFL